MVRVCVSGYVQVSEGWLAEKGATLMAATGPGRHGVFVKTTSPCGIVTASLLHLLSSSSPASNASYSALLSATVLVFSLSADAALQRTVSSENAAEKAYSKNKMRESVLEQNQRGDAHTHTHTHTDTLR